MIVTYGPSEIDLERETFGDNVNYFLLGGEYVDYVGRLEWLDRISTKGGL